ncbi:hypothetical protein GTO91_16740 [Heliobacterium undosum]|uniref:Uncharacterized protein n=1 Tax=Heliomicrobium undosum TaxID=121734 RepID=A0A845L7T1_9FIRM|nr:hypothetical protein [Heliomicrobium undosum]MZP31349.1 hypothetical protein [Heliomicrobium undosum]
MNAHKVAGDQVVGAVVDYINQERMAELNRQLSEILQNEALLTNVQNEKLIEALQYVEKVREFLDAPNHILGNDLTKHGEIAEQIEVNIRNAYDLLEGWSTKATFEGVGRTAPEDYLIEGIKVQSKFINGVNNNLSHVLEHMDKYTEFGRNGSYYQIPKDSYQTIEEILKGNVPEGISERNAQKILEKVREIERQSGKSFAEVVRPSISDYAEVQPGKADDTLSRHENDLKHRNKEKVKDIKDESDDLREQARRDSGPSIKEGLKTGLIGVLIGGGFSVTLCVFKKYKEGKKISNFNSDDWKDIGVDFTKGGTRGGIAATAIYGLTNFTNMSAPLASAYVSSAFGISKLCMEYKKGYLSFEQLIEQGSIVCLETGIVTLGATMGQSIIPIPVVGALIGSFAASTVVSLAKKHLGKEAARLEKEYNTRYSNILKKLDVEYRKIVEAIMAEYNRLGTITKMAFDFNSNVRSRFENSQQLAFAHGVTGSKVLKDINDIDNYFLLR